MRHKPSGRSLKRCALARLAAPCASLLVLGWVSLTAALRAQNNDVVAAPLPAPGFQIRTLSGYAVYYSNSLPANGGIPSADVNLPADVGFGGSAEFDWTRFTDSSTFSLIYTPSYTGRVRYSSLDALNHAFSLNTTRKLARNWSFGFSVAANVSNLEESLFSPTTLSSVASLPTSFEDLATALLQSQFANNPQLGSILTSAPLVQSPLNTLLYGERMFTSSAQSSLSYSYSPRLSVTFVVGGSRTQHLSDSESLTTENSSLILNATSGRASLAVSYSFSPRTQFGASVATNRTSSSLYDLYTTTSLASVGQTLAQRWILQVHGGAGITNSVRQTAFPISTKPYPVAGASLTFKTSSHTFLASYDRTVSGYYGLGATTSSSANATWRWKFPHGSWWMDSTFGWQQLVGNGLTNISGWRSTTGFNQAVGAHLAFRAEYAYLNYSGGLQNSAYRLSQSAVRVSVSWFPPANALR